VLTPRSFALPVVALAAVVALPQPARSIGDAPLCVRTVVATIDVVDSAGARPGDPFQFRTVSPIAAPDGTRIPEGNLGYGIIASATHAGRSGQAGVIALEPRFLALADGTDIPVIADRRTDANANASGASRNIPGIAGAIPFAGYILTPYNFIHHGSDIQLPVGTRLSVLVGNDVARGACRIPPSGEFASPPPITPSPSPEPTATSTPDSTPSPLSS